MGYSSWLAASCCNFTSKGGKHCQNGHKIVGFHPNSEFVTVEILQNGKFASEFRRDVGKCSRFEAFLGDAFDVHAGVWLVGSWATRAGWLPVVAIWFLKVENVAKVFPFRRSRAKCGWLQVGCVEVESGSDRKRQLV